VKLLLAATLMLVLSTMAMAETENYQVGSYVVSFDLGSGVDHQAQALEPLESADSTVYPLLIVTDNNTGASVIVTEYSELTDSTMVLNEEVAALRLALTRGINVTEKQEMDIDGASGFVLSGKPIPGYNLPDMPYYYASYWLDSQECSECGPVSAATTNVGISSTYSDAVTMSFINSIHVAKGQISVPQQPTAPNSMGQVLPPV
jgi:hypothetical protein